MKRFEFLSRLHEAIVILTEKREVREKRKREGRNTTAMSQPSIQPTSPSYSQNNRIEENFEIVELKSANVYHKDCEIGFIKSDLASELIDSIVELVELKQGTKHDFVNNGVLQTIVLKVLKPRQL